MGFGASPADLASWAGVSIDTVIDRLLNYESASTDHDSKIGNPAYVGITTASGTRSWPVPSARSARRA